MNNKKTKILVIEDDLNLNKNLTILLKKNNYDVTSVVSGNEGLENAFKNGPDLIVCDIMLPDIDGYQILERIRNNNTTNSLPFIFITAKAEMHNHRRGMNLGADDYLTKPFKVVDLLDAIKVRLKKSKKFRLNDTMKSDTQMDIKSDQYLFLDAGSNISPIKVSKIIYIKSEGNYSFLYMKCDKKYTLRKLLKQWEKILPKTHFIRIHRSTIINVEFIQKIERDLNSTFKIYLRNCEKPFTVSRRYSQSVKKNLIT